MATPDRTFDVEGIIEEMSRRMSQTWSPSDKRALRDLAAQLGIDEFHVPYPDRNHARSVCGTVFINPGFLLINDEANARVDVPGIRRADDPSYQQHPWRLQLSTYASPGTRKVGKVPQRPLCSCGLPVGPDGECQYGGC